MIKSYRDLEVYKRSFTLAMEIFKVTREFPKEEIYPLTSQVIRSSRSISANISEGWAKRKYESVFKQHLIHALGSRSETENWILFALTCKYIDQEVYNTLTTEIDEIGKMLNKLHQNWRSHGR